MIIRALAGDAIHSAATFACVWLVVVFSLRLRCRRRWWLALVVGLLLAAAAHVGIDAFQRWYTSPLGEPWNLVIR